MRDTQQRFLEIIQWYGYHKKNSQSADLRKQVELLTAMNDNMFTLMTMMYRDMRHIEMRARKADPMIALPANMTPMVNGVPFKRKFQ